MKRKYLAFLLTLVMAVCLIAANIPQVYAADEGAPKEVTDITKKEEPTPPTDELNLDELVLSIEIADEIIAADEWDGISESYKTEFFTAYDSAKSILKKATEDPTKVTQDEIDAADISLWDAIINLMLMDKDDLSALIAKAEVIEKNESKYTAETYMDFKEALNQARAIFADENATTDEITGAYYYLEYTIESLKEAETSSPASTPTPQSGNPSSGTPVPKTSDTYPVILLIALLCSSVALVGFRKSKKN